MFYSHRKPRKPGKVASGLGAHAQSWRQINQDEPYRATAGIVICAVLGLAAWLSMVNFVLAQ
jgi:hypothetical protein